MPTHKTQPSSPTRGLLAQLTLAGAATLAGSAANAQITVTPVNENVGFASGDKQSIFLNLTGSSHIHIYDFSNVSTHTVLVDFPGGGFAGHSGRAAVAAYGQTFTQAGQGGFVPSPVLAQQTSNNNDHTLPAFNDKYYLFRFEDATNNNQIDYGWIEASLTNTTYAGLNLDIISYAYDTSGNPIAAGATTSSSAVPEPSAAVALAAFSALALGAVGARRLKALKGTV